MNLQYTQEKAETISRDQEALDRAKEQEQLFRKKMKKMRINAQTIVYTTIKDGENKYKESLNR
ncbi:MAG: hypothetical protein PUB21_11900 [Bacteroidales bacterium]|nr:hypothetical protein [Bacteroidales bacterium]